MIIDFHTHVFPPRVKTDRSKYIADDPCFALLYSSASARLATTNELIASMDKQGIDISVVLNIGWTKHELCVETNDYIMESLARYPKRLVGFGTVQPRSIDTALAEIERCARGGMKGIGEMRPDRQLLDLKGDMAMKPLIESIIEHNLILLTHTSEPVGHEYPGKGAITPEALYPLITRFPDLTLVCAHWGGGLPFYALMSEVKKAMSNVFFDTAASPFLYNPQVYHQVIQLVGADKILFGSDYPLLPPSRLLKEIKPLKLPEETEKLIIGGNARRLLKIKGEPAKA
ncbi:MAG: amidohydrolase [Chloroflexi bacterium]|nr:amidohydrolase [Chloroflexota bacterium]